MYYIRTYMFVCVNKITISNKILVVYLFPGSKNIYWVILNMKKIQNTIQIGP